MKREKNGFGYRLKKLRKNAGMTQNELADKLAKSGSAVRMWELGSNEPDINTLVELSSIFDCSLDYLLCRDTVLGKEGAVRTNVPVYRLSAFGADAEPEYYKSILPEYLDTGFAYIMLQADNDTLAPLVPRDATVMVRLQESCLDGQTVLFRYRGDIYLRKIAFCDGGMVFYGAFPHVSPLYIEASDKQLEVIGTATEFTYSL